MPKINPQAEELNDLLEEQRPSLLRILSNRGQRIFFPKLGIMAQSADAKGKKINATIGSAYEDDGTPMRLPSVDKHVPDFSPKDIYPYAPSFGKPELREKWKEMMYEKNPSLQSEVSLPIVTCALTHGLTIMGYLFLDPGDKLYVTDKFWGNYNLTFDIGFDGEITTFNTFENGGFDLESFKKSIQEGKGKKVILLNFPNNPAGYTPTEDEAIQILDILKETAEMGNDMVVILDDAYFGLVYEEGVMKESLFAKLSNMHENLLAVKLDGITKEDYAWGFRVGFITYGIKGATKEVYNALEMKTAGCVRGGVSNIPHISQSIFLDAFKSESYKTEKQEKFEILKSRFEEVKRILQDEKYKKFFEPLPYNSGYFMCIAMKDGVSAESIRKVLLEKYDTGIIAIGEKMIRIAYASVPKAILPELFENIYHACEEI